jgi:hypothetical protein
MRRELSVDLRVGGAGGTVSSKRVFGLSVETPEPLSGIVLVGCLYVGLRSQSLADPTLSYGALPGRRAVSFCLARLRQVGRRDRSAVVSTAGKC